MKSQACRTREKGKKGCIVIAGALIAGAALPCSLPFPLTVNAPIQGSFFFPPFFFVYVHLLLFFCCCFLAFEHRHSKREPLILSKTHVPPFYQTVSFILFKLMRLFFRLVTTLFFFCCCCYYIGYTVAHVNCRQFSNAAESMDVPFFFSLFLS